MLYDEHLAKWHVRGMTVLLFQGTKITSNITLLYVQLRLVPNPKT